MMAIYRTLSVCFEYGTTLESEVTHWKWGRSYCLYLLWESVVVIVCVSVCACMCSVAPQLGVVVSVCDWKTASFHHRLKFDYVTRDWEAWVSRVILNYKRQRRWVEEGHLVWKIHSSLQQYNNTSLATVPEKQMLITVFYMHCPREPSIRNLTLERHLFSRSCAVSVAPTSLCLVFFGFLERLGSHWNF